MSSGLPSPRAPFTRDLNALKCVQTTGVKATKQPAWSAILSPRRHGHSYVVMDHNTLPQLVIVCFVSVPLNGKGWVK